MEEEHMCKMLEGLTTSNKIRLKQRAEVLYFKKREVKQVKMELAEARFSQLQDFEKEKDHLKNPMGSIICFNNIQI